MKKIFFIITLIVIAGCFGAKKEETEIKRIVLSSDKIEIKSNGTDTVEFKVKLYDQKNKEVTEENLKSALHDLTIEYYEGNKKMVHPKFASLVPGNYYISSKIGKVTSNIVTVAAISTEHVNNYAISVNYGAQYTTAQSVKIYTFFTGTAQQLEYASNDEISLSNNSVEWSAWIDKEDILNWTIPVGDGLKTVYARFKDEDGNISTNVISDNISLDTTPPNGNITINNDAAVTTSISVQISWSVTDEVSGPRYIALQNEGGIWTEWRSISPAGINWSITTGAGLKKVEAKFMDFAGNISSVVSDTVELNTDIPEGVMYINENVQYTSSQSVNLRMNVSGSAFMIFSNENSNWGSDVEPYAEDKTGWILNDNISGIKTVYGKFLTEYGNERIISDTIILDTDKPTGTIVINDGAAVTSSSSLKITLNAGDITSGVGEMSFSEEGINWTEWEAYSNTKTYIVSISEGEAAVYARFRDLAGNISENISDTIIIDNVPPNGVIRIIPNIEFTSKSAVALELEASDNVTTPANIKISVKNENVTTYPDYYNFVSGINPWNLSAGDGEKTVSCSFMDEMGNSFITSASIIVDTVPPTFDFTLNNGAEYTSKTAINVKFINAIDDRSGVKTASVSGDITSEYNGEFITDISLNLIDTEGVRSVSAKVFDGAGNDSGAKAKTIIYDKTSPVGTFMINNGEAVTTKTSVILNMNISDNFTTAGGLEMQFSNDNITYSQKVKYESATNWNILDTEAAPQTVYARFIDLAGNVYSTSASILLDHTGPNGTVIINGGDAIAVTTSVTLTISIDAKDAAGGKISVKNENLTWSDWTNYSASKNWYLSTVDGEKTVSVRLMDEYGNIGNAIAMDTIMLDTRPLKINNGASITNDRDVALTINYPGAAEMAFANDTNNPTDWGTYEAYNSSRTWILSAGDGPKKVYMRVRDSLGNLITEEVFDDIRLDTVVPSGSITINNGASYTNNSTLSIKGTASDITSNVAGVTFSENENTFPNAWYDFVNSQTYTLTLGDSTQGTRMIYAKFRDAAGNESTAQISDSIVYDTTAPTGIIKVETDATSKTSINLALDANDNITPPILQMCFSLDDKTYSIWEPYSNVKTNFNIGTIDGNKKVYVKYRDGAGNESISTSVSVTLDRQAPFGNMKVMNDMTYTNNITNVAININIGDEMTPVVSMRFSNEAGIYSEWETFAVEKIWTLSNIEETRTVYGEFRDKAGNVYTTSDTIYFDKTPPLATMIINNGAKATKNSSVVLTFNNIIEQSGGGIEFIQISNSDSGWAGIEKTNFSSSSTWSIGTSNQGLVNVYARYTDKAGNVSATTQGSIVFDNIQPTGNLLIHTETTSNAAITTSRSIILEMTGNSDVSGIQYMRLCNNSNTEWSEWKTFDSNPSTSKTLYYYWTLSSVIGMNSVSMQFMDYAGNISNIIMRNIELQ